MLPGPLALMQSLAPDKPWRVSMVQPHTGGRLWRLYFGLEDSPRLTIWEP